MPRKSNTEGTITGYFETAELPVARAMLNVIQGIVKRREGPKQVRRRAKRTEEPQSARVAPSDA